MIGRPDRNQPPLFDVVMGDAVPTFHAEGAEHAGAHRTAMDAVTALNASDPTPDPITNAIERSATARRADWDAQERQRDEWHAHAAARTEPFPVSTDETVRADRLVAGDRVWDGGGAFRTLVSAYVIGGGRMRLSYGRRVETPPVEALFLRRPHAHVWESLELDSGHHYQRCTRCGREDR